MIELINYVDAIDKLAQRSDYIAPVNTAEDLLVKNYVERYFKYHNTPLVVYKDYFQEIMRKDPTISKYLFRLKNVPQNPKWHPEGNTFIHTKIVFNRLTNMFPNNKTLSLAGLFHNLGKFDAYEYNDGAHNAYGHERFSGYYVQFFWQWVSTFSVNPEHVRMIVDNHMIIKNFEKFRKHRQNELKKLRVFEDLMKFRIADNMRL